MKSFSTLFSLTAAWASLAISAPTSQALQVLELPISQVQGRNGAVLTKLSIPRGHSITLSFIASGHRIQSVWLDDPSHLVFNTDTPLCSQTNQRDCGSASVIRIRQLANAIDFPANAGNQFPSSHTGHSTLMTIVATDTQNQQVVYSFVLDVIPQATTPYAVIQIVPDRPYEPPGIVHRQVQTRLAEIRRGLQQAQQQQLIDTQSPEWSKLQNFLALASSGNLSLNDAISQSGVSRALIDRLAAMGAH